MSSASTHLAAPSAARHVVIAGAGFIGLASAIEALAAGWQVTLVDPGPSGGEQAASYGNAGWLSSHSILPPAGPGVWRQVPGFLTDVSACFESVHDRHLHVEQDQRVGAVPRAFDGLLAVGGDVDL